MWCGRVAPTMSKDLGTDRLTNLRFLDSFELGENVRMIRLHICGDFGVSQKFFDIAPRHRQIEQAFSVSFFGSFDVSLQRFHFPLHAGIEIRLFNLFHSIELFPCFRQSHESFYHTTVVAAKKSCSATKPWLLSTLTRAGS